MATASVEASGTAKMSKRIKRELYQLKVIIRQLPPDFTEEKLLEVVSPLPPHSHFYFMPGDESLGPHGFSRAYITFANEADILPFRDQFDGIVMESGKGLKYRAVIEYAPHQGIPKKVKRKPDPRCGTIEQDAEYVSFLEKYESEPVAASAIDVSAYMIELESGKTPQVDKTTPLLKYLKEKRQAKLAAKSRNKLYVADSKGKKKGESKRSSKSKGASDKDGSRGGSDASGHRTRREERDKKKRESEVASKPSGAYKDGDVTSNHVSEDHPRKNEYQDKPALSKPVKETRSSRGSAKARDSHFENGEIREEKGRSGRRNKDRPDRAIYNPRSQDREQTGGRGSKPRDDSKPKEDYGPPHRYSKDRFSDNPTRREKGERLSNDDWDGGGGGGKGGGGGGGRRRGGRDRRGGKNREDYGRAAQGEVYESRSKSSSYRDK